MSLLRVPVWVFVVAAIVLSVGFALATFLGMSDVLASNALAALKSAQTLPPTGQRDEFVIVHGPPTGVARGFQMGLICLVFGGVPAAIMGAVLAGTRSNRERAWSGGWASVFLAGFVFQLSSLALTAFLLILGLWMGLDVEAGRSELISFSAPLLVSVGFGVWGLRSWRTLQFEVCETPPRVTP